MTNCIKANHDTDKSWCGRALGNEAHFKSVDAAVLNGLHYNDVDACWECTDAVIRNLERGTCNEPSETNELLKHIFGIKDTLKNAFEIT